MIQCACEQKRAVFTVSRRPFYERNFPKGKARHGAHGPHGTALAAPRARAVSTDDTRARSRATRDSRYAQPPVRRQPAAREPTRLAERRGSALEPPHGAASNEPSTQLTRAQCLGEIHLLVLLVDLVCKSRAHAWVSAWCVHHRQTRQHAAVMRTHTRQHAAGKHTHLQERPLRNPLCPPRAPPPQAQRPQRHRPPRHPPCHHRRRCCCRRQRALCLFEAGPLVPHTSSA